MTDTLHFSQGYIGILGAISSAGSICGALIYRRCPAELTSKRSLAIEHRARHRDHRLRSCCSFNEATAAVLNFCAGVSEMIALVREPHASRRLLPQALRRPYVRSIDVDHQPRLGARGQCRRAPLSARVQQPARAAHPSRRRRSPPSGGSPSRCCGLATSRRGAPSRIDRRCGVAGPAVGRE